MYKDMTSSFGETAADAVNEHREAAADALDRAADAMDGKASKLGDAVKSATGKAKQTMGAAADYVRENDAEDMVGDLARIAKSNPLPMLIAALAVGFTAGLLVRRS